MKPLFKGDGSHPTTGDDCHHHGERQALVTPTQAGHRVVVVCLTCGTFDEAQEYPLAREGLSEEVNHGR